MATDEDFMVTGPSFKPDLSPMDQHMPDMYSRRIFCFSLPSISTDKHHIIQLLKSVLQTCVDQIPFLGGAITEALQATDGTGLYRRKIFPSAAHLIVKDLSSKYDFGNFRKQNFSSELLPIEELSPAPRFHVLKPGDSLDVCRIQSTFVKNGLLLNFSLNHVAMDGTGITTFIKLFKDHCFALQRGTQLDNDSVFRECHPMPQIDRSIISHLAQGRDSKCVSFLYNFFDEIDIAHYVPPPSTGPPPPPTLNRTFRIPAPDIARLTQHITSSWPGKGDRISPSTALSALVWRATTRARISLGIIQPDETVSFAMPVDIRRKTSPTLPDGYLGNAFITTRADLPVSDLLNQDTPIGLAAAVAAIRTGVSRVNPEMIDSLVTVLNTIKHPRMIALKGFDITFPNAKNVVITSQRAFEPYGWDWGPAFGSFEALCFPSGEGLQSNYILPVLPDGSWEIAVSLRADVMEVLAADEEWTAYARPL